MVTNKNKKTDEEKRAELKKNMVTKNTKK